MLQLSAISALAGGAMRLLFAVFALALRDFLSFESASAQECSAAEETLTTSCGNDCSAYEPCLATNSSDCSSSKSQSSSSCTVVGGGGCQHTCFQAFGAYNSDPSQFIFLVPFDDEEELSDGVYATASNTAIAAIDVLALSPQTSYVWIQGGSSYQAVNRGRVAQLALAGSLLTSQSQVTSVGLVAMDLSSTIDDVPSMVPGSITTLSLANTLLSEFPSHLAALQSVVTLYLNDNFIAAVHSSVDWDRLLVVDLRHNNVSSFEGSFPALTDLYLSDNHLTEIPAAVFSLQHLTKLTIQNNPLSSRAFTAAQLAFLQGLASLDLVDGDFQRDVECSLSDQQVVGDNKVVVCVSGLTAESTSSPASSSSSLASDAPAIPISYSSTSMDYDQTNSSGDHSPLVVVTVVVIFFVAAAFAATAGYYWKQRKYGKAGGLFSTTPRASSKQRARTSSNDLELQALQLNHDDIQDLQLLGTGAFTTLWLVRYRDSELLVSKRLCEALSDHTQAVVDEIELASQFDHPNIVAFIGAAWTTGCDIQALFEFVENGDLRSYLTPSLPRYWTRSKLQLAVDVVEALVYAHAFTPPLAHGDLRSRKVLISAEMRAKISNFGGSADPVGAAGTDASRWFAPEVIACRSDVDASADLFSFGVLLSEFDTHARPYDDAVDMNGSRLEDDAILQNVVAGCLRPAFSDTCPPVVLELAKQCMAHEPQDRPSAFKIAYALRKLQREAFNM